MQIITEKGTSIDLDSNEKVSNKGFDNKAEQLGKAKSTFNFDIMKGSAQKN